jgi:hypothetical protein
MLVPCNRVPKLEGVGKLGHFDKQTTLGDQPSSVNREA